MLSTLSIEFTEYLVQEKMGTNFYLRGYRDSNDPSVHIGKRSAAGLYCFDCSLTLCKWGESGIPESPRGKDKWYKSCPRCNQKPQEEGVTTSSMGLELGFNKNLTQTKKGVASCSAFNWAMPPNLVARYLGLSINGYKQSALDIEQRKNNLKSSVKAGTSYGGTTLELEEVEGVWLFKQPLFEDEYGKHLTKQEMVAIIHNCPIHYFNMIGRDFC